MSTENKTPDPTNVSELAREVAQNIFWEVPLMERTSSKLGPFIQSALSKLAAEKDAEIARHVAALKVAREHIVGNGTESAIVKTLQRIEKELMP